MTQGTDSTEQKDYDKVDDKNNWSIYVRKIYSKIFKRKKGKLENIFLIRVTDKRPISVICK